MKFCLHCGKGKVCRPRGLCWPCFKDLAIRKQHAPIGQQGQAGVTGWDPELTEEELDVMIAEQMANLPDWWDQAGTDEPPHQPATIPILTRRQLKRGK